MEDRVMVDTTVEEEAQKLFRVVSEGEVTLHYTKEEHEFDLSVKFKLPTLKQRDTAEMLFSKNYNKLLRDEDQATVRELLDLAKRRGTWSDEEEERLGALDGLIVEAKEDADNTKGKRKKDKALDKLAELRAEKFQLAVRVGQITNTAIENLAERERLVYMLQNCTLKVEDDGSESPLYATREDVENETNLTKLQRIALDGKDFWSGEGLSNFLHLDD